MDSADPPFPRPAGYWWFGCRAETKGYLKSSDNVDRFHSHLLGSELHSEASYRGSSKTDVDDLIMDGGEDPTVEL